MELDDQTADELRLSNNDAPIIDSIGKSEMNSKTPRHHQPIPCILRDSIVISPSRFWPTQPDRSLPYHLPRTIQERQHGRNIKTKLGRFGFRKRHDSLRSDGKKSHYNLRSKLAHPSSYFRVSEEMGIDIELEVEMEEAKLRKPKALPAALIIPWIDKPDETFWVIPGIQMYRFCSMSNLDIFPFLGVGSLSRCRNWLSASSKTFF